MIADRVRNTFNLRLRLLTSYVVLLLVTLGAMATALAVLIGNRAAPAETTYVRLAALTQGLNYIDFIADMPFDANASFLQNRVEELLDVFAETRQVRTLQIRATPEDTRVIYDSEGAFGRGQRVILQLAHYENRQLEKVLARGSRQLFGGFVDPDGGEWLFGGVIFGSGRQPERQRAEDLWLLAEPRPTVSLHETLAVFGRALAPPLIQAGVAGLLIAIVLAALISRTIAKPLQRLAKGATDVARGELAVKVPVSGPAELRSLAESFNRMTAEVMATNSAQRDFLGNVSHDLKTPLTSIQGYAQAIIDGAADDPQAAAQTIYEEASRLNRMVVELTDLERLQAGKLSMQLEPIDMGELCQGVVQSLAVVAESKRLSLVAEVAPAPGLTGDGDRLAQVLVNLISNALEFTPAGGSVRVKVAGAAGGLCVAIEDSGIGIPSDEQPRIFERFYQVDKSRGPRRGTGLGLAITKEIVEAHGGRISVESGGAGQGAVFRVWLPAAG